MRAAPPSHITLLVERYAPPSGGHTSDSCSLFCFLFLIPVDRYATSGVEETMELLHRGNQNRAVEPTKRNETSSRSHAVLQIVIDKEMKTAAIQKTILIGTLSSRRLCWKLIPFQGNYR